MGLFRSLSERRVIAEIIVGLMGMGMGRSQADSMATQIVDDAVKRAKDMGASGRGFQVDAILRDEKTGTLSPPMARMVNEARADGATDADIRDWLGVEAFELFARETVDNTMAQSVWMSIVEQESARLGKSGSEDELKRVSLDRLRRARPLFGSPTQQPELPPEDRYIPWELNRRIMRWVIVKPPAQPLPPQFRTMNAYIRQSIRDGML